MERDSFSDQKIRDILSLNCIAIIGMSKNSSKAAHYVPKYLADNGYDIIPVNPTTDEILKRRCYSSISKVDASVEIVDIFRPSDQVLPIVQEAIKKRPKVIWFQKGIYNAEAQQLALSAGIPMVFNRCMLEEHRRLVK